VTEKTCTKCGKSKSLDEFYKHKGYAGGRTTECKKCLSERAMEYHQKNPERAKKAGRKWRDGNGRFQLALTQSVRRALEDGFVACNATPSEIEQAFTGKCQVCGIPEGECTKKLSMDHDHVTGAFRGWLCQKCNWVLGALGDSEEGVLDLLAYIQGVYI